MGIADKKLYIVAGCNGAGKTTASFTLLPELLQCKEFVNADAIAYGLSPFQPESVAFEAGRIMLHRIDELMKAGVDFAFETTLATKSYAPKVKLAQKQGYTVTLVFFWLNSVELAKQRVRLRVEEGGHNIPEEVIERRYYRGVKNLIHLYVAICNNVLVVNNSDDTKVVAFAKMGSDSAIFDKEIWDKLNTLANE